MLFSWFETHPRRVLAAISAVCLGLLAFGLYLQHVVGLEPCPMCIVQRYALVLVLLLVAGFGAFVAARQSWLQWYPPEIVTCGRDFYGMIETFPLKRAVPMIFKGSGDCTKIDWTFLGGSIANWSFLCFVAIAGVSGLLVARLSAVRRG
jgi:protein dithiol:quinone oxidoreductase